MSNLGDPDAFRYFLRVKYPMYVEGGDAKERFLQELGKLEIPKTYIEFVLKIQVGYADGAASTEAQTAAEAHCLWVDPYFAAQARDAITRDSRSLADIGYSEYDSDYAALVRHVCGGTKKPTRQGGHTFSRVAKSLCVKMHSGRAPIVPVLHCKYVPLQSVLAELSWFLRGETNSKELERRSVNIWSGDAAKFASRRAAAGLLALEPGELGPVYGYQWCRRASGDQVARAAELLVSDPYSRRILVDSWDPDVLDGMAVPPCHYAFQFVCEPRGASAITVHCVVSMRSTDVGLGLPFNVASYAMLTHAMCASANGRSQAAYVPGTLTINMADCHVYGEHVEALCAAVEKVPTGGGHDLAAFGADLVSPEKFTLERLRSAECRLLSGRHFDTSAWGRWRPPRVPLPLIT